jgi:hypothetical protein
MAATIILLLIAYPAVGALGGWLIARRFGDYSAEGRRDFVWRMTWGWPLVAAALAYTAVDIWAEKRLARRR